MKAKTVWDSQVFPELEGCLNCGSCCAMLLIPPRQIQLIKDYLSVNPKAKEFALAQPFSTQKCVFRNNESKKCMVYPVRPYICKAYGVTDSPLTECPFVKRTKTAAYNPPPQECSAAELRLINEAFGNPKYAERYRSLNAWMSTRYYAAQKAELPAAGSLSDGFLVSSLKPEIDSLIVAHGEKSVPKIAQCIAEYSEALGEANCLLLKDYANEKLGKDLL